MRVMDCERMKRLIGLMVFIKLKITLINPPNYLLPQPHKCEFALAVLLGKSKLHPRCGNDAGLGLGQTQGFRLLNVAQE